MVNSIQLNNNKTLKLMNVLFQEVNVQENDNPDIIVTKMENYIKSKGAMPVGPLIQKSGYSVNEEGQINIRVYLMMQTNNFIHNVEEPYKMESIICVRNCIYTHYTGPENKLKLAYDKINVIAFEQNVELSDENYTVFVDQQDDYIVADVFVEKLTND